MPGAFAPSSVTGAGWRCSQALRSSFEAHVGPGFPFNAALRWFIAEREGSTLAEAIEHYEVSLEAPPAAIAEHFEDNGHLRAFHASHPDTTRADAVAAWWAKRARP